MKIKLPSLPFWARSPQYRRTINRRLAAPTARAYVVFENFDLEAFSREFERREPFLARVIREAIDGDLGQAYRPELFTPADCYLPPAAPRRRWRWERDPAVIGSVIGFFVVGIALYFLGGF